MPPPPPSLAEWEPCISGFTATFEDDYFFPADNHDENYTGGGGIELWGSLFHFPGLDLFDWIFQTARIHDDPLNRADHHGFLFGITAFTPSNIHVPTPIEGDRPYASLTFADFVRQTISHDEKLALTTDLTVAVLGLGDAEAIQTQIHRWMFGGDVNRPMGWSHQISNGGEPTLKYSVLAEHPLIEDRVFDLKTTAQGELGYYTAAEVGFGFRLGWLNSPWWSGNANPLSGHTQAASSNDFWKPNKRTPWEIRWRPELYAWAGVRGRLTAYNALLEGQLRQSDVTFTPSQMRYEMYDYELGLSAGFDGWLATWTVVAGRSPEFYNATYERSHHWGGFVLSYFARE